MMRTAYETRIDGTLYSVEAARGNRTFHVTMRRDGKVKARFSDPAAVDQIHNVPLHYLHVHGVCE